jgi:hypothetical protein
MPHFRDTLIPGKNSFAAKDESNLWCERGQGTEVTVKIQAQVGMCVEDVIQFQCPGATSQTTVNLSLGPHRLVPKLETRMAESAKRYTLTAIDSLARSPDRWSETPVIDRPDKAIGRPIDESVYFIHERTCYS